MNNPRVLYFAGLGLAMVGLGLMFAGSRAAAKAAPCVDCDDQVTPEVVETTDD
ncbi:MAG: hypothetical protein KGI89_15760 [Euryarchaeota archaeon]|nr:hypothetical protein [Euryarchaeota archaeon]